MSRFLLLRLDAPLMSFGGVMVDNYGVTDTHPGASLLTGLLGNALGYEHRDGPLLDALQRRLVFGSRIDRPGERMQDFQTVSLGQDHLVGAGWTTRGAPEPRAGGNNEGTHIRYRDFIADAVVTVALELAPAEESPTLAELDRALRHPARPLFIGRKPCLPSSPLSMGLVEATTLLEALRQAPWRDPAERPKVVDVWLPETHARDAASVHIVRDRRDWLNQIHGGRRFVRQQSIQLDEVNDGV